MVFGLISVLLLAGVIVGSQGKKVSGPKSLLWLQTVTALQDSRKNTLILNFHAASKDELQPNAKGIKMITSALSVCDWQPACYQADNHEKECRVLLQSTSVMLLVTYVGSLGPIKSMKHVPNYILDFFFFQKNVLLSTLFEWVPAAFVPVAVDRPKQILILGASIVGHWHTWQCCEHSLGILTFLYTFMCYMMLLLYLQR